ncbi:MAG: DUF4926 domain-containing protein [Candidatus Tectomicrobia bacterium]|nr:DUF4926 domain-containing protein [Candidatus Tectomicrobia bacterium]
MADFTAHQDVVLRRDIREEGVCAGAVGTVVERHDVPRPGAGWQGLARAQPH